jgi:hypothetical protein
MSSNKVKPHCPDHFAEGKGQSLEVPDCAVRTLNPALCILHGV